MIVKKWMLLMMTAAVSMLVTAGEAKIVKPADVAGKQIEWCMVGDSITWAGYGDYFRKYLLEEIP